jgi:hypothetical protein
LNPLEVEATPMDCWGITSPGAIVTVSKYSVPKGSMDIAKMTFMERNPPENDPDPYLTDWRMGIN